MTDNKFNIRLYCVLLSTDIPNNKQYILSTHQDSIEIPYFDLDHNMFASLESSLITLMKSLIFVSDIELLPQLISLHNPNIESERNYINAVYGFLVKHTTNIDTSKVVWQEFNCLKPNKYSNLIMQVIQNLR